MLTPPLSRFNRLLNEALADWGNERPIRQEVSLLWSSAFHGCIELLNAVQHREVQDRFAYRVAAVLVEFLLRVTEDPKLFTKDTEEKHFKQFNKNLRVSIENKNKNVLKSILYLEPILARRWKLQEYDRILTKLGFKDLL